MADNEGDYLSIYKRFFEDFAATVIPDDQLPVKVAGYNLCAVEVLGEIVDWILQYLSQKQCPSSLVAPLTRIVLFEIDLACQHHPTACGYRVEDNVYQPLKLMQVVTGKVNEVCLRYHDNGRMATLPPMSFSPPTSTCAIKNTRRLMEDRHVIIQDFHALFNVQDRSPASYYAVFDGHAGTDAATYSVCHLHQFLAQSSFYPTDPVRAFKEAFFKTDTLFLEKSDRENLHSGTTAVCALLRPKEKMLYVAWLGDSQAVLVRAGRPIQIVNPHKPDRLDERKRIEDMGGCVVYWGTWRVNGQLAVSRAIGDTEYKPFVSADPDIREIPLDGTEDFLVLACDGLWDFVTEEEVVLAVFQQLREAPDDVEAVSQSLVVLSKNQGSADNISVIVVFLRDPAQLATVSLDELKKWASLNNGPLTMETNSPPATTNPFANGTEVYQKSGLLLDLGGKTNGTSPDMFYPDHPASNGKDNFDNDEDDYGPETDVDAVDDVLLSPAIAAAKAAVAAATVTNKNPFCEQRLEADLELQRQQLSEFDPVREPREETPTPPADEVPGVTSAAPEADNVAESGEDSEDEWNYYRIDPSRVEQKQQPTPAVCEKSRPVEDMESPLNPDAAEFIPSSPTYGRPAMEDLLAQSPVKGAPMVDVKIPSQSEFLEEVSTRPGDLEFVNGSSQDDAQAFDVSDISSTKAEFGDESTTSFVTSTADFDRIQQKVECTENLESSFSDKDLFDTELVRPVEMHHLSFELQKDLVPHMEAEPELVQLDSEDTSSSRDLEQPNLARESTLIQADDSVVFQADDSGVFQADDSVVFQADDSVVFQADDSVVFQADNPVFEADAPAPSQADEPVVAQAGPVSHQDKEAVAAEVVEFTSVQAVESPSVQPYEPMSQANEPVVSIPAEEPAMCTSEEFVLNEVNETLLNEADGALLSQADGALLNEADGALLNEADGALLNEANEPLLNEADKQLEKQIKEPSVIETKELILNLSHEAFGGAQFDDLSKNGVDKLSLIQGNEPLCQLVDEPSTNQSEELVDSDGFVHITSGGLHNIEDNMAAYEDMVPSSVTCEVTKSQQLEQFASGFESTASLAYEQTLSFIEALDNSDIHVTTRKNNCVSPLIHEDDIVIEKEVLHGEFEVGQTLTDIVEELEPSVATAVPDLLSPLLEPVVEVDYLGSNVGSRSPLPEVVSPVSLRDSHSPLPDKHSEKPQPPDQLVHQFETSPPTVDDASDLPGILDLNHPLRVCVFPLPRHLLNQEPPDEYLVSEKLHKDVELSVTEPILSVDQEASTTPPAICEDPRQAGHLPIEEGVVVTAAAAVAATVATAVAAGTALTVDKKEAAKKTAPTRKPAMEKAKTATSRTVSSTKPAATSKVPASPTKPLAASSRAPTLKKPPITAPPKTAVGSKPSPTARSQATTKPAAPTTKASAPTTKAAAPTTKPAASSTRTAASTTRPTTTTAPRPKSATASSPTKPAPIAKPRTTTTARPAVAERKASQLTNGDVGKPIKRPDVLAAKKPTSPSTALKSNTAKLVGTVTATKTTTTKQVGSTTTRTNTLTSTTARPKSAAVNGVASRPKPAASTLTKTRPTSATQPRPVTDKQVKETANKQISSSRTTTTARKVAGTKTTVKGTSVVMKTMEPTDNLVSVQEITTTVISTEVKIDPSNTE